MKITIKEQPKVIVRQHINHIPKGQIFLADGGQLFMRVNASDDRVIRFDPPDSWTGKEWWADYEPIDSANVELIVKK